MKAIRNRLFRGLLGLAIALAALGGGSALAQEEGVPLPSANKKTYVYQYFLVGLCVALGMALLCKPANRDEHIEKKHSESI